MDNPLGLNGIEFVEFASPDPQSLHRMFLELGFSRTMRHRRLAVDLYEQNDIRFLINREPGSHAARFSTEHGPCISAMGWRFTHPTSAHAQAVRRGARPSDAGDHSSLPALAGIGGSLIYLVEKSGPGSYQALGFDGLAQPDLVEPKGFTAIDHLTNNVENGTMRSWSEFYKSVFAFTEVRTFDIRGRQTGLRSYALRSPCGSFCIPINEADDEKSQINEYLQEYRGAGIQHLAFLTGDLLDSLRRLDGTSIRMLDIDDEYYAHVFDRVPGVTEDRGQLRARNVLLDGDAHGYLLQIFTHNLVGPIFFELIQRKNHHSFGEGNFAALFRSIERDQVRRGVLRA